MTHLYTPGCPSVAQSLKVPLSLSRAVALVFFVFFFCFWLNKHLNKTKTINDVAFTLAKIFFPFFNIFLNS